MTAPLFLVPAGGLDGLEPGGHVELTGPEARHAATVMRLGPSDPILVGDGRGARVHGEVLQAQSERVLVVVRARDDEPVEGPDVVLVQALSKGDRDLLAAQTAVELGVGGVVPWEAERSIVRWKGAKAERARQKWADALATAAKQARRGIVPRLDPTVSGTGVAALAAEDVCVLVLHEQAEQSLSTLPEQSWAQARRIALVVGPEGGVSEAELMALTASGALPVRLGPHVLRASTAGPTGLAVMQHRLGRW